MHITQIADNFVRSFVKECKEIRGENGKNIWERGCEYTIHHIQCNVCNIIFIVKENLYCDL